MPVYTESCYIDEYAVIANYIVDTSAYIEKYYVDTSVYTESCYIDKFAEIDSFNVHNLTICIYVVFDLFNLILYVPSTIFQLNRDGSS